MGVITAFPDTIRIHLLSSKFEEIWMKIYSEECWKAINNELAEIDKLVKDILTSKVV